MEQLQAEWCHTRIINSHRLFCHPVLQVTRRLRARILTPTLTALPQPHSLHLILLAVRYRLKYFLCQVRSCFFRQIEFIR